MELNTSRVYDVITTPCFIDIWSDTARLSCYRCLHDCWPQMQCNPGAWTAQPTLDTASVFVCNHLCCWTSSQTWSRFHVVLKLNWFQSVLGHNIVEVWRLMSRPRRVCRHSVIMCVVSVGFGTIIASWAVLVIIITVTTTRQTLKEELQMSHNVITNSDGLRLLCGRWAKSLVYWFVSFANWFV